MGQRHVDHAAMHRQMCSERAALEAGHLAYLQAKLNLTEQQQAAWNKWRQVKLDGAAKERAACLDLMPKGDTHPSLLDREAHMEKLLSLKLDEMHASRPALEALYNVLTAEQKAIFDRSAGHHRGHGMERMGMGRMGMGGPGMHGPDGH
jgi:hypothetical protein